MVVLARRVDVQREARLHRKALQRVRQQRDREPANTFAAEREPHLRVRTADEIHGCGRAGLVHRHGRRAVARDALPAGEGGRERVPERGEHVLDEVVLVDVEVAARDELEVEPAVEGQQRQQVVEEADLRRDARPTRAVEVDGRAERRLGRGAHDRRRAAPVGRGRLGAEHAEQRVVLPRSAHGRTDALGEAAHDEALRLEPVGELLRGGRPDEDEVRAGWRAVVAGRDERRAHTLALGDRRLDVEPRLAERRRGDPSGRRGHRRRGAPAVELRRDLATRDGEAHTHAAKPNAFDSVRSTTTFGSPPSSGRTLEPGAYSAYASSTTTAAAGCSRASAATVSPASPPPSGCPGCRPTAGRPPRGRRPRRRPRAASRSRRARRSARAATHDARDRGTSALRGRSGRRPLRRPRSAPARRRRTRPRPPGARGRCRPGTR